ncbi:MAG: SH3 domain-containing protein [Betaproteobacteria bacterium]|nr:SH3 domain-containing protein [Betaproteobacteria bacterium]
MYPRRVWIVLAAAAAAGNALAAGLDFRSVAEPAAVLYDAPSAKSKKLYVVSRGYPFEVVVVVESWSKVRDANGDLTWIESRHLADKRTVLVKVPLAQVRDRADDNAPVVFQAQQNVLLELLEVAGGWLRVRHRDGQAGFVKVSQVWGA